MAMRKIDQDHTRFRDIVRGKIKQDLRKYVTSGEMIGKQGKRYVSIPLPQIDLPKFRFGSNQGSGVGQGDGEEGDAVPEGEGEGAGTAGDQAGEHALEVEVSLEELAKKVGVSSVDMAIRLQLEGYRDRPGGARLRGFSLSEIDVEAFASRPWTATATDAGVALPDDDRPVHPRFYGTYPRKIRRYALERGILTVEDAIRSSTSLPAQILGLRDRGQIREGFRADIVVLNLDLLRDRATTFEPHQYSEGVDHVLVGGVFVVEDGKPTGSRPGVVITR